VGTGELYPAFPRRSWTHSAAIIRASSTPLPLAAAAWKSYWHHDAVYSTRVGLPPTRRWKAADPPSHPAFAKKKGIVARPLPHPSGDGSVLKRSRQLSKARRRCWHELAQTEQPESWIGANTRAVCMKTDTHRGIADLVSGELGLEPATREALRDGSADPDLPLAKRRHGTSFRGKHHGGAANAGYVTGWLRSARHRWLSNAQTDAAYACGVGLHYLVDAFIRNGSAPNHTEIERRCAYAFENLDLQTIRPVTDPAHECVSQVEHRMGDLPLGADSGTEMVTEATRWAQFAGRSVFAQRGAPIDVSALLAKPKRALQELRQRLANDPIAVRYETLDRKVAGVVRERKRLFASAKARGDFLANRVRIPAMALGLATLSVIVFWFVRLVDAWLPDGLGLVQTLFLYALCGLMAVMLCTYKDFGPLPVYLLAETLAASFCLAIRWRTRGRFRPYLRQRYRRGCELARRLRSHERTRSAVMREFTDRWNAENKTLRHWYAALQIPQVLEDVHLRYRLSSLYRRISFGARMLSYLE